MTVSGDELSSATPATGGSTGDEQDGDDDPIVLAWWHNPVNLIVLAIGLALVCGALGWVLGDRHAQPSPNRTDLGFLQDMRWHHDQALQMSFIYLSDAVIDPALSQTAQEIVVGQGLESGLMVQLLRDFGKAETNETDTAMAWMGEPTAIDTMPGMATKAQLQALASATGAAADQMFVTLMVAHHQGGIHMADFAAKHAAESPVRELATQISGSQTDEIAELHQLLTASTNP